MDMKIYRAGSRPAVAGPDNLFTGSVRIDALFEATEPGRTSAVLVTFEPGARTAWHTHPLDPVRGRAEERNPRGRRRLLQLRQEALAWRHGHHRHEPYRRAGVAGRRRGELAGEGQRRAVPVCG